MHHTEVIEDAVQAALLTALETWAVKGVPKHPTAWLYRVAQNRLLGELRQHSGRKRILEQSDSHETSEASMDPPAFGEEEIRDDFLRMLFV